MFGRLHGKILRRNVKDKKSWFAYEVSIRKSQGYVKSKIPYPSRKSLIEIGALPTQLYSEESQVAYL